MKYSFIWSTSSAASLSCLALFALIVGVPMLFMELSRIEEELELERDHYIKFSNSLWKSLLDQSSEVRKVRQLRRKRQSSSFSHNKIWVTRFLGHIFVSSPPPPPPLLKRATVLQSHLRCTTHTQPFMKIIL